MEYLFGRVMGVKDTKFSDQFLIFKVFSVWYNLQLLKHKYTIFTNIVLSLQMTTLLVLVRISGQLTLWLVTFLVQLFQLSILYVFAMLLNCLKRDQLHCFVALHYSVALGSNVCRCQWFWTLFLPERRPKATVSCINFT